MIGRRVSPKLVLATTSATCETAAAAAAPEVPPLGTDTLRLPCAEERPNALAILHAADYNPAADDDRSDPRYGLPPPATQLPPPPCPSRLASCIARWETELIAAHKFVCKTKGCTGLRPLSSIVATCPFTLPPTSACLQAVEVELLLHNIYYGFPVLPEGVSLREPPEFTVPNYPMPAHAAKAVWENIESELSQGILRELQEPPRQCTPLTYKEETTGKIRPIRDYSAPHDDKTSVTICAWSSSQTHPSLTDGGSRTESNKPCITHYYCGLLD